MGNRGRQNALACPGRAHGFAERGAMRPLCARRRALPLPAVARTADARRSGRARARPDPRAARVALARTGCARLRGRPVSRAQRGPRPSLQHGHDSQAGSAADGLRDVPARVLQERRPYGPFLGRGPGRAGSHSSGLSAAREQAEGMTDGAARGAGWRDLCRLDHVCINAAKAFHGPGKQ